MYGQSISQLQFQAWKTAEDKGFHEKKGIGFRDLTLVRLALVHTEISEATQEVKRHWKDQPTDEQRQVFGEELADAVIRILDLAECTGVDLERCLLTKMEANRRRPHLFGTPEAGEVA